jgi:Tfp pilus assembly protein PilO
MLKTRTSRWSAATALVCVLVLALAWLLLVSPRLARAGEIRADADGKRVQNDALQLKVAQLRSQFAELPKSQAELEQIAAQMPVDAAMPALVRTIDSAATGSGVDLLSLTPATAVVIGPSPGEAAKPAATPQAGGASGGTAAAPAPAGVRVVAIPVTIVTRGEYFQQVLFLKKLQAEMTRLLAISNLQLAVTQDTGGESDSGVTMTVTGRVFALPDAETGAVAGTATGTGPAGPAGATQAPATTAGGSNS